MAVHVTYRDGGREVKVDKSTLKMMRKCGSVFHDLSIAIPITDLSGRVHKLLTCFDDDGKYQAPKPAAEKLPGEDQHEAA